MFKKIKNEAIFVIVVAGILAYLGCDDWIPFLKIGLAMTLR